MSTPVFRRPVLPWRPRALVLLALAVTVLGFVLLVAGVVLVAGWGWALVVAGVLLLAAGLLVVPTP